MAEYKTVGSGPILHSRLEALINEYDEPVSIKKEILLTNEIIGDQQFAILSSLQHRKRMQI